MKGSCLQLLQADLVLWTAGSQPSSKGSDFRETAEKKKSRLSLPFPLNGKVCLHGPLPSPAPHRAIAKSALMELQCRSSRDHLCFHHNVGGSGDGFDAAGRVAHPCLCAGRCFGSGRAAVRCAARHRAGMPRKRKSGQFPQHSLQRVTVRELLCRRPVRCRPPLCFSILVHLFLAKAHLVPRLRLWPGKRPHGSRSPHRTFERVPML